MNVIHELFNFLNLPHDSCKSGECSEEFERIIFPDKYIKVLQQNMSPCLSNLIYKLPTFLNLYTTRGEVARECSEVIKRATFYNEYITITFSNNKFLPRQLYLICEFLNFFLNLPTSRTKTSKGSYEEIKRTMGFHVKRCTRFSISWTIQPLSVHTVSIPNTDACRSRSC